MHSRIYQITTSPVTKDEFLSESHFDEHWFVGSIADYVADDLVREYEIDCLKDILSNSNIAAFDSGDSFLLLPGGKEEYFKKAFADFSKAVSDAAKISLNDFIGDSKCSCLVDDIRRSFCEKYGYYVSSEEFDDIPFDEFIRCAEIGRRYYIGNVLDYHW